MAFIYIDKYELTTKMCNLLNHAKTLKHVLGFEAVLECKTICYPSLKLVRVKVIKQENVFVWNSEPI